MSPGSTASISKRLKRLIETYRPALFSEHLAWSTHDGVFLNDLLPLPYNDITLAHVCAHIDEVQEAIGMRMLLENPATYVAFGASSMSEVEFLRAVAQRTGCGLLLDVNNVYVCAVNHGFDAKAYIDAFPVEHVGEFHLAGFAEDRDSDGARLLIDDHGRSVSETVWDLYRHTLTRWTCPDADRVGQQRSRLCRAGTRRRTRAPHPHHAGPQIDRQKRRQKCRKERRMNAMLPLPVESGQARLQASFAEAIFLDEAPMPVTVSSASGAAAASRFGVYRNNVIAGLINAIAARYPVTRKLLWPETFDVFARMFVAAEPPRSPVLIAYGDSFPQYLRSIGQGASAEYLADIAELEAARTRAYHAADVAPVSREAFAALDADELPQLRLELHPSVSLVKSRFPVVTIWETNRHANDNAIHQWAEKSALIARPHLAVEVWRLTPGACAFLTAIAAGETIGAAIAQATAAAPDFDLGACMAVLIAADIVVGIGRPDRL